MRRAAEDPSTLCLFDVDGTLTAARQVSVFVCARAFVYVRARAFVCACAFACDISGSEPYHIYALIRLYDVVFVSLPSQIVFRRNTR